MDKSKVKSENCTFCKEPMVHMAKDFNSPEALVASNMLIKDPVKLPNISPTSNKETDERMKKEKNRMMLPNTRAPIKAPPTTPRLDCSKGMPVMVQSATNKLEPELIPKT